MHRRGKEEIGCFYAGLTDGRRNVFGPISENVAVTGWRLAIESYVGNDVPGHVLAEQGEEIDAPDTYCQLTHYMVSFRHYGAEVRLIGEHIYEDVGRRRIEKMDPADVTTPGRARELLTPLLDARPRPDQAR
ncbi:hypothetical protein ABTY96_44505 [Streptomyces sp. NPDC096057]|uniref:hypothetical protein n=1 Tax=Streptomyces sp. NPDC096057 TaxID=3155543 RepID=UPI00332BA53B